MYIVHKVTTAGGDWWHVEIIGPKNVSIPMKRMRPGAEKADIEKLAQAWCDKENGERADALRVLKGERPRKGDPRAEYKRCNTVVYGRGED